MFVCYCANLSGSISKFLTLVYEALKWYCIFLVLVERRAFPAV